jgi:hypothetical protein
VVWVFDENLCCGGPHVIPSPNLSHPLPKDGGEARKPTGPRPHLFKEGWALFREPLYTPCQRANCARSQPSRNQPEALTLARRGNLLASKPDRTHPWSGQLALRLSTWALLAEGPFLLRDNRRQFPPKSFQPNSWNLKRPMLVVLAVPFVWRLTNGKGNHSLANGSASRGHHLTGSYSRHLSNRGLVLCFVQAERPDKAPRNAHRAMR